MLLSPTCPALPTPSDGTADSTENSADGEKRELVLSCELQLFMLACLSYRDHALPKLLAIDFAPNTRTRLFISDPLDYFVLNLA